MIAASRPCTPFPPRLVLENQLPIGWAVPAGRIHRLAWACAHVTGLRISLARTTYLPTYLPAARSNTETTHLWHPHRYNIRHTSSADASGPGQCNSIGRAVPVMSSRDAAAFPRVPQLAQLWA